jgi:rhodanese-related sulfurtransferase
MKHMLLPVLALLLSVMGVASFAEEAKSADISREDLVKAIKDKKVVILDCNGTESYAKGHVPGALDFTAVKDDLAKKLPEDKATLIVAYCSGPG